ncbi:MAG: bifunctional 5,10-methylenetetrahydrofolate dehydrogenase/5,10-methenyltetrahydrofolate cyclohydrolase [Candidatus Paceibacterota bacterium]|jgi:methylenetetrahydrofolate dehydrogenase (NADP+)/methenyltetrahydrofolate cyclohydrolase
MTTIIDGRKLSKEILAEVKQEIALLPFVPVFCDILVGDNPVPLQYVNMKRRKAEELGIRFHEAFFPYDISTDDLVKEIQKINKIENMCGVIVQLPLPENLDQVKVLDAVNSHLDVDCLSTTTSDKFYNGDLFLGFPTALACMAILDSLNLDLTNKKIVVMGQGKLVGKPVSALLEFRNLKVEIVRSKTENKEEILKEADVVISGMGQGKYIKGDIIKEGVVLIDAGSSESDSGIIGDVDLESVEKVAGFVSPVPGGVGPMTVAMLFRNVLKVAQNRK